MSEATSTTTEELREVQPSDYENLYAEQVAECERLKSIIAASRLAPIAEHPLKDARPAVSADRLRALVGPTQLLAMTRAEKIAALGLDPNGVDDAFLRKCFGKSNDGSAAAELHKTSPLRYRQLKEASLLLGIYAN